MEKSAQQEGNEYEYLGKNCELLPFRWTALECFGDNPSVGNPMPFTVSSSAVSVLGKNGRLVVWSSDVGNIREKCFAFSEYDQ